MDTFVFVSCSDLGFALGNPQAVRCFVAGDLMNICHEHKLVFLAVPRTACRSAFKYLDRELNFGGGVPTHDMRVPALCRHYEVFTVVRNPYSRLVSCWGWFRRLKMNPDRPSGKPLFATAAEEWEDFSNTIRAAVDRLPKLKQAWGSFRTQYAYLRAVEGVDIRFLRFENLRDELFSIVTDCKPDAQEPRKIPRNSERNYSSHWQEFYRQDPEAVEIAQKLVGEDFDYCLYDKDLI